jgi:hypothetical protein
MRTIKFKPDTGNGIIVQAENGINVTHFIELVQAQGGQIDLSKNLLTELVSKATFLTGDAILPDGDLRIFSTVKDPKGNKRGDYDHYTRAQLYDAVKEFKAASPKAADHFSQYGNITQVSSVDLRYLLETYKAPKAKHTTTTGALSGSRNITPKRVASSVSVNDDEDFRALEAAQASFNPRLTRR